MEPQTQMAISLGISNLIQVKSECAYACVCVCACVSLEYYNSEYGKGGPFMPESSSDVHLMLGIHVCASI